MPNKIILRFMILKGLDGSKRAWLERVDSRVGGAKTVGAESAHVSDHGELEGSTITARSCRGEGVVTSGTLGLIVIFRVWFEAADHDVVIPGCGCLVGRGDLGGSGVLSCVFIAIVHRGVGQRDIGVPADCHA